MQQLKSDIRSVLIPAKDGFSATDLQKYFHEFVGSRIPFATHGFSSLHELLVSMPDVCRIELSGNGVVYHAVADESTQNLRDLVCRQRSRGTKKSSRRRQNNGMSQVMPSQRNPNAGYTWRRQVSNPRMRMNNFNQYPRASNVFMGSTVPVSGQAHFRSLAAGRIPFDNPRFRAWQDMQCMQLNGNRFPNGLNGGIYPYPPSLPYPLTSSNSEQGFYHRSYPPQQPFPQCHAKPSESVSSRNSESSDHKSNVLFDCSKPEVQQPDRLPAIEPSIEQIKKNFYMDQRSRALLEILFRHKEGIHLHSLQNEVDQKYRKNEGISYEDVGELKKHLQCLIRYACVRGDIVFPLGLAAPASIEYSLNEEINNPVVLPDPVCIRQEISLEVAADNAVRFPTPNADFQTAQAVSDIDSIAIRQNVFQVVKEHPEGVRVSDFSRAYFLRFKTPLLLGVKKTVKSFLEAMPSVVLRWDGSGLRAFESVKGKDQTNELTRPALSGKPQRQLHVTSFADFNTQLPLREIPVDTIDRSFTAIIIAFYSVEDFFVQPTAYSQHMQDLRVEMGTYFSHPSHGHSLECFLPLETVMNLPSSLLCAVLWRYNWMRALAFLCSIDTACVNNSLVFVRLLDIGVTDTVRLINVRRLPTQFIRLHAMAHRAYMPGILKAVHSDYLVQKCRSYVDKTTFNIPLRMTKGSDSGSHYRRLGKTPVNVFTNHGPQGSDDLTENRDLAKCLLHFGLVLEEPNRMDVGARGDMTTENDVKTQPIDKAGPKGGCRTPHPVFSATKGNRSPLLSARSEGSAETEQEPSDGTTSATGCTSDRYDEGSRPDGDRLSEEMLRKCVISYEERFNSD